MVANKMANINYVQSVNVGGIPGKRHYGFRATEADEEETDEVEVQAAAEAREEHKISHRIFSSSKKANSHRHIQRTKRDWKEDVFNVRATTTSVIDLNSPQIKRHSCLSKPSRRRG